MRITLPVLTQSLTKSIDQRSFGRFAVGFGTALVHWIRRLRRILIARPSSRYSRYTCLWFAEIPSRTSIAVSRRYHKVIREARESSPKEIIHALYKAVLD